MAIIITISEIAMFFLLLFTYFKVSKTGEITGFAKWLITLSSFGILFLSDKMKLILWVAVVAIIWLIKYSKKEKNDELA